jgi:hypothetical protein
MASSAAREQQRGLSPNHNENIVRPQGRGLSPNHNETLVAQR